MSVRENHMNKNNTVVFDETNTGDNVYVSLIIGERRYSGGGNTNALATCERSLGCYILLSVPDSLPPFVFSFLKLRNLINVIVLWPQWNK